ncbi:MAG: hypothetical protein GQ570_03330 [Helicobacteraceae bacterium]|nr:hypothetical protein [Helicobacteraceae bacterium]
MRTIVLLGLLFSLLLSADTKFIKSNSYAFIDAKKEFTLVTIPLAKKEFKPDVDSMFKFSDKIVWSYFTITNKSAYEQSLIIHNSIRFVRYVDVLVIHEDGTQDIFMIGTDRKHKYHSLGVLGYPLEIKPNERVEIYTRHNSIGLLNTNWNVSYIDEYYSDKALENSLLGGIFGVVFLVVVYGFILFYITGEKSNLCFNGFMIARALVILSLTGFFYTFSYDVGILIRTSIPLYVPMLMFFESLFLISLYNLKQTSTVFYRIFSTIAIVAVLMFLMGVYSIFILTSIVIMKSMIVYVGISAVLSLIFALYAVYKRWKGSLALLISIMLFIYVRYSYMNLIDENNRFTFIMLSATILETLLILLTLSLKVKEIYDEKIKAREIILNHAKYLSLGKMHAATIHQLRTPIAHIGAIASRVKFVFERHRHQLDEEEYNSSEELEQIVSMANSTITDLYNLYSTDQEKEFFDLKESIQEILLLVHPKSQKYDIEIILSLESAPIFNYPNSLKHIFIVIVENAIDILQERNILNPTINISLSKSETNYEIKICDNGGGISIKPIEDIFEMYKSSKKTKGLGLGLTLAKDLSNFSQAEIIAFNTEKGACFILQVPFTKKIKPS